MLLNELLCNVTSMEDGPESEMIMEAIRDTHSAAHTFKVEVRGIYKLKKSSEELNYRPFERKLHNKFLLWHGSKSTSVIATLIEGIRMPAAESSVGMMFGRGIYLTDCFSKAASKSMGSNLGVVFLAEAALGEMHMAYEPDQFA